MPRLARRWHIIGRGDTYANGHFECPERACSWILTADGMRGLASSAGLVIEVLPTVAPRYEGMPVWGRCWRTPAGIRTWSDPAGQIHDEYGVIARGYAVSVRCGGCGADLAGHIRESTEEVPCRNSE